MGLDDEHPARSKLTRPEMALKDQLTRIYRRIWTGSSFIVKEGSRPKLIRQLKSIIRLIKDKSSFVDEVWKCHHQRC